MNFNARFSQDIFDLKYLILVLFLFFSQVNAETKITAQKGDTLFKLSKKYGISLKELMHKNSFTDASKILEGEVIIIPHENLNSNNNPTYKVLEGDTLYKIARKFNIKENDIVSLNNLSNSSYIRANQIILLPKGTIYQEEMNQENNKSDIKKISYHQLSDGEKLLDISNIHNIPIEEIISLNRIKDNKKTIRKIIIREPQIDKWIKYGSLNINWSDWRYLSGSYITKAKNKKNKFFFLAINCKRRTLNNTLDNSYWTNWYFPKDDFEFNLINDFCHKDYKI